MCSSTLNVMAITMKDIAELAEVSRGTVDRVLNKRGRVKPEVEQRVWRVAKSLGYKPNSAAKRFSTLKKKMLFGILLPSKDDEFFEDVIRGIRDAEKELEDYGFEIILHETKGYDVEKQLDELDELLKLEITALGFFPLMDERIARKIDTIVDSGIPVITINSDIENSKRNFHVGTDFEKSGKIAAGLLGLLNSRAKVLTITGSSNVFSHQLRYMGFEKEIKRKFPKIEMLDFVECRNDDFFAYDTVKKALSENQGIDAVFIIAGGIRGVCEAVDLFPDRDIKIICFDTMDYIKQKVIRGQISVTIDQQAYKQGYETVKRIFAWFVDPEMKENDRILMENIVQIAENFE